MRFDFETHRAHDYLYLARRWRSLARKTGLRLEPFVTADDFEVFGVRSPALEATGGIYFSAGIHGDEAASTEGLYLWAELNAKYLRRLPLLLFPCLNPWGLVRNRRVDAEGRDLNRSFHLDDVPRIKAHKELLRGLKFSFAMCLHEDYDAQGVYLYEVRQTPLRAHRAIGDELLAAAGYYVPVDLRGRSRAGEPVRAPSRAGSASNNSPLCRKRSTWRSIIATTPSRSRPRRNTISVPGCRPRQPPYSGQLRSYWDSFVVEAAAEWE
jgi:murein peptide amidase A